MKRGVFAAVGAVALLAGAVLAWNAIRLEQSFRSLVASGDAALSRGDTFEAVEAFSGALALKNDSMVAHLKRGESYLRRGELGAALRDVREAAELDPGAPRPAELLGDVNAAMGRFERAAEHYQRFISLDDRAPRILYKLGLTLYRDGQAARAVEPLNRAIALDQTLAEAHLLLGICLREQQRPAEAVLVFQRALKMNPALTAARSELADVLGELGRTRERIEQLEAIAALEPASEIRVISVGLAYAQEGRLDAALETLRRAAERFPASPRVATAIGQVWLDASGEETDAPELARALAALQGPAARATASSETLTWYGRALFLTGDADLAEIVLQQATTRLPVHPRAFSFLAEAADRLGHPRIAQNARQQSAALQLR